MLRGSRGLGGGGRRLRVVPRDHPARETREGLCSDGLPFGRARPAGLEGACGSEPGWAVVTEPKGSCCRRSGGRCWLPSPRWVRAALSGVRGRLSSEGLRGLGSGTGRRLIPRIYRPCPEERPRPSRQRCR